MLSLVLTTVLHEAIDVSVLFRSQISLDPCVLGLMQNYGISIVNAHEVPQSCTTPLVCLSLVQDCGISSASADALEIAQSYTKSWYLHYYCTWDTTVLH